MTLDQAIEQKIKQILITACGAYAVERSKYGNGPIVNVSHIIARLAEEFVAWHKKNVVANLHHESDYLQK